MLRFVLLAPLAACLHHGIPADRSIEMTSGPGAHTPASRGPNLKVMTFNTHGQPGEAIARAIAADRELRSADVIILEETHRIAGRESAAAKLAHDLGYYSMYAPGHVQDDGTDGVSIIARMPITAGEVIELPGYNVHWNTGRRIALAATIEVDERPVTIIGVHLENRITVAQRRAQMAPVIEFANKRTTPVVIAGDFNTSPFTWIAHAIPVPTNEQDDELEALMRTSGFDTPVIDSGATSRFIGMKLDAIYTRGFVTDKFATSNASEISDHIALWTSMRLL